VFIHPTCDLIYRFDGSRPAELDHELLESMATESMTSRGLVIQASMPIGMIGRAVAVG
jgi:hypothetical protein